MEGFENPPELNVPVERPLAAEYSGSTLARVLQTSVHPVGTQERS
jgi:hypothetical protein